MDQPGYINIGQIESDPEIATLLGIFVARWSLAEHSLMLAFLAATGSRTQEVATTILASTVSTEAKIRIVNKLLGVAVMQDDRRIAIREAIKQLERLCPDRNALMHHVWGRRDTGVFITIDYREADPKKSQKVRTANSLRSLCNAVVEAAKSISEASGSAWINAEASAALKV